MINDTVKFGDRTSIR